MQRNWDVIRRILLAVEALPGPDDEINSEHFNGLAPPVAAYHMRLLMDAGLAEGGGRASVPGADEWRFINSLTWAGHELLDSVRRDSVWNKVRTIARNKGVDLTFDVVKTLAKAVIDGLVR